MCGVLMWCFGFPTSMRRFANCKNHIEANSARNISVSPELSSNLRTPLCFRLHVTQEVKIAALSRKQQQLGEEGEALRECLEASGALAPVRFLANLHRRKFAETLQRQPGPWPGSLHTIMQNPRARQVHCGARRGLERRTAGDGVPSAACLHRCAAV